jgi:Domain of unknown function (DUF1833)
MPATGNSPDLKRAYASAPAGVDLWPTLTLEHPAWVTSGHGPYYLTSAPVAFTARLETTGNPTVTFQPFPFALVLPAVDGAGQQDLQVTLTNADPTITQAVQLAHADPTQRIVATYRVFLSTLGATQTPQGPPLRLAFDSIQVTEEAVAGIAGRSDVLNRRFPGLWYDVALFPGLDR